MPKIASVKNIKVALRKEPTRKRDAAAKRAAHVERNYIEELGGYDAAKATLMKCKPADCSDDACWVDGPAVWCNAKQPNSPFKTIYKYGGKKAYSLNRLAFLIANPDHSVDDTMVVKRTCNTEACYNPRHMKAAGRAGHMSRPPWYESLKEQLKAMAVEELALRADIKAAEADVPAEKDDEDNDGDYNEDGEEDDTERVGDAAASAIKYLGRDRLVLIVDLLLSTRTHPQGNCIVFTGGTDAGYGFVWLPTLNGELMRFRTHVLVFVARNPDVPLAKLHVSHRCSTADCCNEEHLTAESCLLNFSRIECPPDTMGRCGIVHTGCDHEVPCTRPVHSHVCCDGPERHLLQPVHSKRVNSSPGYLWV